MIKRTECPNCETVVDVEQVIVKPRAYNILGFNVLATLPNYVCPHCGEEFEDEDLTCINDEHLYNIDFKSVTGMTVKEYKESNQDWPHHLDTKQNKPLNSKFRVYIKSINKLYDVEIINFLTNVVQICGEQYKKYLYNLDECILEQYSNTFDKNKKKICEGDIVLVPLIIEKDRGWNERQKEHVKYKVVFDKDGYFKLQEFDECGSIIMANYMEDEIEIIGNIYENEV